MEGISNTRGVQSSITKDFRPRLGTARCGWSDGVQASDGSQATLRVHLSPDWVVLAVFSGHLVLAGDAGGRRSGDERRALLRYRAGLAAVPKARAGALLPRCRALLSRSLLHRQ